MAKETPLDYRESSERHINTCKHLLATYSSITNADVKDSVLRNTYYLAGYILECIYTYTICDLIGYNVNDNVRRVKNSNYSVSFFNESGYQYSLMIHDLDMKADFIQQNGGDKIDDIPILGQTQIVSSQCTLLYNSWKPGLRYKCKHTLTFAGVNELVQVACEIQSKLLNQNP